MSPQFGYQYAIKHLLSIDFGEIESSHRYVIQYRLKLARAWWTNLLALRTMRASQQWEPYWVLG